MRLAHKIGYGLLLILLALTAACGGSPPPATPPHDVTLKLVVKGTPTPNLAGFYVRLVLPSGLTTSVLPGGVNYDQPGSITPDLNADGSVIVTVSGGSIVDYSPATASANGSLYILVTASADKKEYVPFVEGEFATVSLNSPSGNFHLLDNYSLIDFTPLDKSGLPVTGLIPSYEIL